MKKYMRKITAFLVAAAVMMAMSVTSFAGTMTRDDALGLALKNAGLKKSQVRALEVDFDDDDNTFEIEFTRKSNKAEYDYEISAGSGRIIEKSVEYKNSIKKGKKKIGKTKALKKVAKASGVKYSVVKKGTCNYKYKKKVGKYIVKFTSGNYRYEYEVSAPNGKIIETEMKYKGK